MQTIIQGIGHLPAIITQLNCHHFMMVCGSSYHFLPISSLIETLTMPLTTFSDFTPNPLQKQVDQGVNLFLSKGCDAMLAIGGGSAIDVAKCIKLACIDKVGNIPFIAIPTTAGTGAESTHNAVVYQNGIKQTVTDGRILPNIAILEPSVLDSLPIYQKKCSMMDALCQGIESWWSVNSTSESKAYSKKAVELIMTYWKPYIFYNDKEAAWQIMQAANYSGRAINLAQTTAAHAMSYKITSLFNLPHGYAVAVCLPEIWQFMLDNFILCTDSRGQHYLHNTFHDIAQSMRTNSPKEAIQLFREIMEKLELRNPSANDRDSELPILTNSVNPVRLKNNPVALDSNALHSLYQTIIK